jgi:hypothetical protein
MREPTLWSSESGSGEIESKDGFDEHHGARSRSKRLRCAEECGEAKLVREGRNDTLLYTQKPQRRFPKEG